MCNGRIKKFKSNKEVIINAHRILYTKEIDKKIITNYDE